MKSPDAVWPTLAAFRIAVIGPPELGCAARRFMPLWTRTAAAACGTVWAYEDNHSLKSILEINFLTTAA